MATLSDTPLRYSTLHSLCRFCERFRVPSTRGSDHSPERTFGIAQDIVRIVANQIVKASATIKGQSQSFPITVGLPRADLLSPLLFLLWLEATLRVGNLAELGIPLPSGEALSHIEFADNVNLISASIPNLQKQIDKLENIWATLNLRLAPEKIWAMANQFKSGKNSPERHFTNQWKKYPMAGPRRGVQTVSHSVHFSWTPKTSASMSVTPRSHCMP